MLRYHKTRQTRSSRASGAGGFSLIELMLVVGIMMIVAGIGFMALQPALKDARATQAFDRVLMQLRVARQRAIAERKQYMVCFGAGSAPLGALTPMGAPNAGSIQVYRWDAGTALSAAVQISTNNLPSDMLFQTLPGLPNSPATVPDGFGNGGTAIDFDQGAGGNKNQVMFMPDGSAHDIAGNWNSGVIYVARTNDLYSSRAVTLYGATGRIRGWRLQISGAAPKWFIQ